MNAVIEITRLRCAGCGCDLPVMGRAVIFQCGNCLERWILSGSGLEPAVLLRAEPPEGYAGDPVMLPFWVIEAAEVIFAKGPSGVPGAAKPRGNTPAPAERGGRGGKACAEPGDLASRIERQSDFRVFVPAFLAVNPHAYLKVGRLMTRVQPRYKTVRSGPESAAVPCGLRQDQALRLVDYIFISTLPASMLDGGRLEDIRVRPSARPKLVEFPFDESGAYLVSVHCGFQISRSLVDAAAPRQVEQPL